MFQRRRKSLNQFFLVTLLSVLALSVSCAHVNSVSITQIPKERKKVVKAEASKWIIFFLSFDNDYVDQLNKELIKDCEDGQIKGILTKDETYNYFIGLVVKRAVTARGYCIRES